MNDELILNMQIHGTYKSEFHGNKPKVAGAIKYQE